jgi:lysophospholipid acyltransferase
VNDSDSERQKKSKQITAQQTTLFCSAIWHGLYPGYFVSFFHWALLLQISQELFRVQRTSKKFEEMRKKLKYLELIIVNFFLGYFGVCFVFMSIDKIWQFFGAWWYVPPVLVYIGNLLVVRMGLLGKKKRS